MADQPFLSIVIPAYNEERRLPGTLEKVLAYVDQRPWDAEVIVVDDGSRDRTVEIARGVAAERPEVRVIENDHRGKGYTVRTGMLAGRGRYVMYTDADLATPIEETDRLLEVLEGGADVAIGTREGLGARRYNEPWLRHVMGRVFNLVVRTVSGLPFRDTQCGFKGFRREVAHELFRRARLYGDDASPLKVAAVTGFDVEILCLARWAGYRIVEVPVEWYYGEESKVNPLVDSWRNLSDVFKVRWYALRGMYREK